MGFRPLAEVPPNSIDKRSGGGVSSSSPAASSCILIQSIEMCFVDTNNISALYRVIAAAAVCPFVIQCMTS